MPSPRLVLRSAEFRRERQEAWHELDRILAQIERHGLRRLGPEPLARLPVLHRAAVSSLSVARAISLDRALVRYLESLTARSFLCVYGSQRPARSAVVEFFVRRFPRLVRRHGWQILLAAVVFAAGTLTGHLLVQGDLDRYYALVPDALAEGRTPLATTEELRAVLYDASTTAGEQLSLFASFLFTHNAQIGLMCFVLGFLAGLPVLFLLFQNGLGLGAMSALYASRAMGLDFWCWVLPHGVTEMGALVLCGGAGFVLGQSLVFPGRHGRLENLARAGRRTGQIVLGCVAMFFLAALIEGFFRQLVTDLPLRALTAIVSALAWVLYLGFAGRGEPA